MSNFLKNLPIGSSFILSNEELGRILQQLIGLPFELTGKSRTDGSNLRKLVLKVLYKYLEDKKHDFNLSNEGELFVTKGVPKLLNQLLDTYIVTNANAGYNLQIWNRKPSGNYPFGKLKDGTNISHDDIRLILVHIQKGVIDKIIIFRPSHIEANFGVFGKPTIKHQLMISGSARSEIINSGGFLVGSDTDNLLPHIGIHKVDLLAFDAKSHPDSGKLLSIQKILDLIKTKLIGYKFSNLQTKNKGQELENLIISNLGYKKISQLEGAFPDIRHQRLEVKVQDSPTVDLGKYSPIYNEIIDKSNNLGIEDVRYLIALTNSDTVNGIIILPGKELGEYFCYVSDTNFKCQRLLPKELFQTKSKSGVLINPSLTQ